MENKKITLSTHILNTSSGKPAFGVDVVLFYSKSATESLNKDEKLKQRSAPINDWEIMSCGLVFDTL